MRLIASYAVTWVILVESIIAFFYCTINCCPRIA